MVTVDRRRFMTVAGGAAAVDDARAEHRPRRRHPGASRHRNHQGRPAHRRPHAGEPVLRALPRHRCAASAASATRTPPCSRAGSRSGTSPTAARDVLPFHPTADDLGAQFLQGLDHTWTGGQQAFAQRRLRPVDPREDAGRRWPTWSARTRRSTTRWPTRSPSATPTTARSSATPTRTATTCSPGGPGNDGKGGGPVLYNDELGYGWTTYPERLEDGRDLVEVLPGRGHGLNAEGDNWWGWTSDPYIGNYGDNSLLYFNNYRNAKPGDPLFEKARRGTKAKDGQDYFEILRSDVATAGLPKISYIAAPEAFSEHSNWPTNYGAWYIAKVLDALTADPDVWSKTALFITYDENDGFFDHLVPPHANNPHIPGASTVPIDPRVLPGKAGNAAYPSGAYGMGPRVPMFVISPWSKGGWVSLRDVRPHLGHPVHGEALRRPRAQHHAVAPGGRGRPHLGLRLLTEPAVDPAAARHVGVGAGRRPAAPRLPAGAACDGHHAAPGARHPPRPADRLRPRGERALASACAVRVELANHGRIGAHLQARFLDAGAGAAQLHDRRRRLADGDLAGDRCLRRPPARAERVLPPAGRRRHARTGSPRSVRRQRRGRTLRGRGLGAARCRGRRRGRLRRPAAAEGHRRTGDARHRGAGGWYDVTVTVPARAGAGPSPDTSRTVGRRSAIPPSAGDRRRAVDWQRGGRNGPG